MSSDLEPHGRIGVVRVGDALDWSTAPDVRTLVSTMWDGLAGGCLVLDLGATTFCDSTGLGTLVSICTDSGDRGVRLIVAAPPPGVLRMLRITGLSAFFELCDSAEDALRSARADL
ncbi:STAS domain-containing protein [Streptosporangium sp. NPDC048047]|uniref:STAS domain-containing protein n=1 Tax=Streptosporangium sp. NPDC048047 TaxID=3155748 RepID=UPI0034427DDE